MAAVTVTAVWSSMAGAAMPLTARMLATSEYAYDGATTYCWGVRASVSSSSVTDDMITVSGSNDECPLQLQLQVNGGPIYTNQSIPLTWTVAKHATASALFTVSKTPLALDARTHRQASILHSNVHACLFDSNCDVFTKGDDVDAMSSQNQVGNISDSTTTFSSSELAFETPGKHTVLAHIIVVGANPNTRYDFAVFTTVDVLSASAAASAHSSDNTNGSGDAQVGSSSNSSGHALSKSQIIILSVVGALMMALFALVMVFSLIKRRRFGCGSKWNEDDDDFRAKQSSNLRTRSSDWTELYAIDDALPSSVMVDDSNTIAILRASRASTPSESPTSFHERMVADFRHDVARWDVRSSASPITPSSSAILIAAIQDPDQLSSTPANDCFVPLESLVLASPMPPKPRDTAPTRWAKRIRSSSRGKKNATRKAQPPEDSGDEQEVDI